MFGKAVKGPNSKQIAQHSNPFKIVIRIPNRYYSTPWLMNSDNTIPIMSCGTCTFLLFVSKYRMPSMSKSFSTYKSKYINDYGRYKFYDTK